MADAPISTPPAETPSTVPAAQPAQPAQPIAYMRNLATGAPISISDPREIPAYAAQGYELMSPQEAAYALGYQPPSLTEAAKAAGEGVLGTVLPIVGPAAESALLGNAPEQLQREQRYPWMHMGGGALGIGLGGLAGGVLKGGLAGAAKLTGPAMAERAGLAARSLFGAAPPTAIARIGAAAADFTAQGAMYGGYDAANRMVLGDPQTGAEDVAREIGLGAMTGGLLGAGGSAGLAAIKGLYGPVVHGIEGLGTLASKMDPTATKLVFQHRAAIEAFDRAAPGIKEVMQERPNQIPFILANQSGFAELNSVRGAVYDVLDAQPGTARFMLDNAATLAKLERQEPGVIRTVSLSDTFMANEIMKDWPQFLSDPGAAAIAKEARVEGLTRLYNDLSESAAVFEKAVRSKQIEDLLAVPQKGPGGKFISVPFTKQGVATTASDIGKLIDNAINVIRGDAAEEAGSAAEKFLYHQPVASQLEIMSEAWKNSITPGMTAVDLYNLAADFTRTFQNRIKWGDATRPMQNATDNVLKDLSNKLVDVLTDQNRWGPLALKESVIREAYKEAIAAEKAYLKRFMNKREWVQLHPAVAEEMPISAYRSATANPEKISKWINAVAKGQGAEANADFDNFITKNIRFAEVMRDAGMPEADGLLQRIRATSRDVLDMRHEGDVAAWVSKTKGTAPVRPPLGPDRTSILDNAGYFKRFMPGPLKWIMRDLESVRNPVAVSGFLNAMDQVSGAAQRALDTHVAHIFQGAAVGMAVNGKFPSFTRENFADRSASINSYAANPELMARWIEGNLGPAVSVGAPLAGWIHVKGVQQHQHMSTKLPKPVKLGMLDPSYKPSPSELVVLNRHAAVAHDPYEVARAVRSGRLTPDHIEAGDAMWPATMNKLRVAVAEKLFEIGKDKVKALPTRVKDGIAQLLGTDLEWRQSAQAIAGTQRLYQSQATPQQAAQSKIDPRVEMKSARMYATSTQATTGHLEKGIG